MMNHYFFTMTKYHYSDDNYVSAGWIPGLIMLGAAFGSVVGRSAQGYYAAKGLTIPDTMFIDSHVDEMNIMRNPTINIGLGYLVGAMHGIINSDSMQDNIGKEILEKVTMFSIVGGGSITALSGISYGAGYCVSTLEDIIFS